VDRDSAHQAVVSDLMTVSIPMQQVKRRASVQRRRSVQAVKYLMYVRSVCSGILLFICFGYFCRFFLQCTLYCHVNAIP